MIELERLKQLAKLYNMKPWQQEKHYIQSAILVSLAEYPLVFKGGTYLWFFHQLPRFSEDLDFTASEKFSNTIMEELIQNLATFQIESTGKKMNGKHTGTSFRIMAKGPLYRSPPSSTYVYVEISLRENIITKPLPFSLKNENYDFPAKIVSGMALEEVAAEKVRAIMTRNKSRDIFDLAFLIEQKKVAFDEKLINTKMKYYNEKFSVKTFMDKAAEKQNGWKKELSDMVLIKLPPFEERLKIIQEWIQK